MSVHVIQRFGKYYCGPRDKYNHNDFTLRCAEATVFPEHEARCFVIDQIKAAVVVIQVFPTITPASRRYGFTGREWD